MTPSDNPYAPTAGAQWSGTATAAAAPLSNDLPQGADKGVICETTTADFMQDVVEASRQVPVLVDFWAPWCGPCKQLTPVIEKVVNAAKGSVRLVKLNIDDHPAIPGQMGIQSIPAVVAFVDGRPADGFMGAVSESEVKAFVDKLAAMKPKGGPEAARAEQIAALMEQAKTALDAGRNEEAAQIYSAILGADDSHAGALGGLASVMISSGALDDAEELLNSLSEDMADKPEILAARKQLEQTREVAALGNRGELEARIADNGGDFEARLALAKILNVQGEREQAAAQLFAIMRQDRAWNDEAARKQLLDFFAVWGPGDAATLSARRQLSSLLFS
ncbi:thioredoxin family protein [Pseudohoeflea coraliihabitans]|uniref:Co-chaperone YbbN n=1 Tax=Pseudohoeflea coraliihabitans TaxID=2860393 RepID=A0ABS6WLJ2_9HYPH|nr:co-chaperone YbbN [Pseudohoeflea sp. DP4N28-3]MBW3096812.1 co-chaperone YbbN [Pseudohoeflea sp. DP4N28-3]